MYHSYQRHPLQVWSTDQLQPAVSQSAHFAHFLATPPALLTAAEFPAAPSSRCKQAKAMALSSALPPITAKLATKILCCQFVAMKELLDDNITP
jgi:hypothetical protein